MTRKKTALFSIPKSVHPAHGWDAGQVFVFLPKDDAMLLIPVPKLEELAGIARKARSKRHRDRRDRF